jgi:hypothetical protein
MDLAQDDVDILRVGLSQRCPPLTSLARLKFSAYYFNLAPHP